MLRRRKDDTMNGKVLIELPKRTVNIVSCPFSPSEQQFYNNLELKMNNVMEQLVEDAQKAGVKANYMSVLLLLLRLRQGQSFSLRESPSTHGQSQLVITRFLSPKTIKKTWMRSTQEGLRKVPQTLTATTSLLPLIS